MGITYKVYNIYINILFNNFQKHNLKVQIIRKFYINFTINYKSLFGI
jgi:hypothetical protein